MHVTDPGLLSIPHMVPLAPTGLMPEWEGGRQGGEREEKKEEVKEMTEINSINMEPS